MKATQEIDYKSEYYKLLQTNRQLSDRLECANALSNNRLQILTRLRRCLDYALQSQTSTVSSTRTTNTISESEMDLS